MDPVMDYLWLFIIPGVIAIIAVALYVNYLVEKKRTEGMQRVAEELGFEFSPKGDGPLLTELSLFNLFTQGHSRRLYNLMRGEANNLEVDIFDYTYVTGSGKSSHTWNQTIVCFGMGETSLPSFSLRPETFWDKIGSWFGYQNINFDTHAGFSDKYLLRGRDEEAVRGLFPDEVLGSFERQPGLSVEGYGHRLVFYRQSKRVDPDNLRAFLEEGFKVLALFTPPADGEG
jgi:carbonic anhydrase